MTVGQERAWNYHDILARRLNPIVRSPLFSLIFGFIGFEIAYFFAFRVAISFGPGSYSPLWLPSSVLLCALLAARPERWWIFILGIVPIRIFGQLDADFPLWHAVANIVIDIAKGVGGAIALRHFMRNPLALESVRDLAIFVLFAVLLIPALAAFAGAAAHVPFGDRLWPMWLHWFMGDAVTQLVVTPPIFYWVISASRSSRSIDVKRLPEAGAIAVGLVLSGYLCVSGGTSIGFTEARFYAPIPFMFWAALRFGMAGASGAVAVVAAFIVNCAAMHEGPFTGLPAHEVGAALQNFLLLRSAPLYFIAALMEQRSAAERALQDSEKRFRAMADSAPVLLWMSGTDKLGVFFNQGWLRFTGRTLERELGDGWIDGVHPDDRQHCLDICHSTFDTRQPFEVEYRLRRYDGEYRWVLDRGTPRFAPNGEFLGYIGSAIDITDRKGAEEGNRALAHVQRLAIIGELTATVAHELRQPSAAIMSNAEAALALLESGQAPSDEIREIVTDIKRANLRANEVLGHIQGFLRKRETGMEALDLNSVVADVLLLVAGDSRKRRIQICTELGEGLPVLGNRTQLQQVLINLIVNAMDAMSNTPDDMRHITIETKANGDGHVEVAVADRGTGIAPGNLPRLFESFFTTRAEGMGLGLSIARSIIESHHGRIWAEANPGGGAIFRFTVPRGHPSATVAQGVTLARESSFPNAAPRRLGM
jgi:PAS domain S-box-containing protein